MWSRLLVLLARGLCRPEERAGPASMYLLRCGHFDAEEASREGGAFEGVEAEAAIFPTRRQDREAGGRSGFADRTVRENKIQ